MIKPAFDFIICFNSKKLDLFVLIQLTKVKLTICVRIWNSQKRSSTLSNQHYHEGIKTHFQWSISQHFLFSNDILVFIVVGSKPIK